MDFMKDVADSITKAVNYVVDQNRKAAMINRLKIVIRHEKETQARAYIGLGKYYFDHLRDAGNSQTEPFCTAVEKSAGRLKRAYAKLDELTMPADSGAESESESAGKNEPEEDAPHSTGGCSCGPECGCGNNPTAPDHPFQEAQENLDGASEKTAPEESAPDDEDFLRPFSVIQNDGGDAGNPEENAAEDGPEPENPEKQ